MPEAGFSLGLFGDVPMRIATESLLFALEDFGVFWPAVRDELRAAEETVFAEQGPGWPELKPSWYKQWKDANFPGEPILQLTHALVDSLTIGGEGEVYEPAPMWMRWGTRVTDPKTGDCYPVTLNEGLPPLAGPRPALISEPLAEALALATAEVGLGLHALWEGGGAL